MTCSYGQSQSILFVERYWHGHCPTYVKLITAAFLSQAVDVQLLCPEPEEVETYLRSEGEDTTRLKVVKIPRFDGPLHNPQGCVRVAEAYMTPVFEALDRELVSLTRDAQLYINVADLLFDAPRFLPNMERRFGLRWGGLYMQPWLRTARLIGLRSRLRRRLQWAVSGKGRTGFITTLDTGCLDDLAQCAKCPIIPFPDVTDETSPEMEHPLAKELRTFAAGRRIVGLLGNIARWKGIFALLDLHDRICNARPDIVFAVCGPLTGTDSDISAIERRVAKTLEGPNSLFVRWGRINDGLDYNSVMSALDIYWAVYPGHYHSSNNLTKAALLRIPVVCGSHGLMADMVRQFSTGSVAHTNDTATMETALLAALEIPRTAEGFQRYFKAHSQAQLQQVTHAIACRAQSTSLAE